jgi:hypothetical protein
MVCYILVELNFAGTKLDYTVLCFDGGILVVMLVM